MGRPKASCLEPAGRGVTSPALETGQLGIAPWADEQWGIDAKGRAD